MAGQAFPDAEVFAAAKIAIFIASILAGAAGIAILWRRPAVTPEEGTGETREEGTAIPESELETVT